MPETSSSASDKWRSFLAAFQLDRVGAGRHIVRDERGFKIAERRVDRLWLASIQPSFARSAFLMVVHLAEGHPLALFCYEGSDGLPIIRGSPTECPALNDRLLASLKHLDVCPSTDGITLDGIGYSVHVRSYSVSADITFRSPRTESLRGVERALFGVAQSVALISENSELTDYLAAWQPYLSTQP